MTKIRLATYLLGAAVTVAAFLVPAAQAVLLPTGLALLGLATRWPEDRPPEAPAKDSLDSKPK